MSRSRRQFLKLVAAGAMGAAAGPAGALARTTTRVRKPTTTIRKPAAPATPAAARPPAAMAAEIEKQKGYAAAALKTIRGYELPTGSEQAFVFRPMPARRGRTS